jgi:hypothetical protein
MTAGVYRIVRLGSGSGDGIGASGGSVSWRHPGRDRAPGLYGSITNRDSSGQHLGLTTAQRREMLTEGVVSGALLVGPKAVELAKPFVKGQFPAAPKPIAEQAPPASGTKAPPPAEVTPPASPTTTSGAGTAGAGKYTAKSNDAVGANGAPSGNQKSTTNAQNCFSAGTLVATPRGLQSIETIGSGDTVWSFDFPTGQWLACRVASCHYAEYNGQVVTLTLQGGTELEVTADHPFWVVEEDALPERPQLKYGDANEDSGKALPGRWVLSQYLRVGDQLSGFSAHYRCCGRQEGSDSSTTGSGKTERAYSC